MKKILSTFIAMFLALYGMQSKAEKLESHHYYSCSVGSATWIEYERNIPKISNDRSPRNDKIYIDYKEYDTHHEISVESPTTFFIYWNESSKGFTKDVKYFSVTRGENWFNYVSPDRSAWNIHLSRVYKEDWLGFLTGGSKDSRMLIGIDCKRKLLASDIFDK